ncbi:acyltransferase [Chryseobacterium tongliaoense]|uniref:acyltransferase n=1 Tax=Chryseobacterium tongliaoense TaxID=3240933 RepID=UPI003515C611
MKALRKLKKIFFKYVAYFSSKNKDVLNVYVNSYCKFSRNTIFGKNNHFNGCKILGKGIVTFGDNFHSAENLKIMTTYHNYDGEKIPYDETTITKNVTIEDNVWIGLDVIILGGVTIGEGAIIQAGSVVVKSIPKYAIAGGSPAVVFSNRNIDKYLKLKSENKFF